MKTYANDFKWNDVDTYDNQEKEQVSKVTNNDILSSKREIYLKFKTVNPNYEIPDGFVKGSNKIEYTTFQNKEYKYCTYCGNWKSLDNYSGKKNVAKNCKLCEKVKRFARKDKTKEYRINNADKIKTYNAEYRKNNKL